MKENKTASQQENLSTKNTTLMSKSRVLVRPNSLRPMKSLMKIKSLRPQLNIQVGATKAAEKLA